MEELVTDPQPSGHSCRFCDAALEQVVVDLGSSPLANSYLTAQDLNKAESFYPLCVYVCTECWLVQLPEVESAEAIFSDYAYFSSFSDSWLDHARRYTEMARERFALDLQGKLVVEVASNDGYLLQYFQQAGVQVLGIEPALNIARAAREKGIVTVSRFFGEELGRELAEADTRADLIVSNNVLAHVPDLNDFVAGFPHLLARDGVWTIEVPHLLRLLDEVQFDTIYHEHFSYFSLGAARTVFDKHGLEVFDVEELSTHGGSLRIFVQHAGGPHEVSASVADLIEREDQAGLFDRATYQAFSQRVKKVKRDLLTFLIQAREEGKTVVGYGAPAKGNTLLNYCGVRSDLLDYTVDRSPHKQNHFLPGTRIPILVPEEIRNTRPDYVLILPWNLEVEISSQMAHIAEWGGRFVVPIPKARIVG